MTSSIYLQHYVLNGLFNFARALYISTYSLYLVDGVGIHVSWVVWLMITDLVLSTAVELPTGAFADSYGRKLSFVVACGTCTIGYVFYAFAMSPWVASPGRLVLVFVGEVALAVAVAFYSGALDAWIVDHPSNPHTLSLQNLFAKAHAIKNAFYVVGGVVGIALFAQWPRFPGMYCLAAMLSALLTAFAAASMRRDQPGPLDSPVHPGGRSLCMIYDRMADAVRTCFANRTLAILSIYTCAAMLLLQVLVVFWPYYLTLLSDSASGRTELYWTLAAAWVSAYGSRAIGNGCSGLAIARRWPNVAIGVSIAFTSACVLSLSVLPLWASSALRPGLVVTAVVLYAIVRWGEGAGESLRQAMLNALVEKSQRAAVLSAVNVVALLGTSIALLITSAALSLGLSVLWMLAVIALVNLSTLLLYNGLPSPPKGP